jgi:hypothetical protein
LIFLASPQVFDLNIIWARRKCHALEAARKRLSSHLENKTLEAIEKEAKLNHDIANLKAKDVSRTII